MATSGKEGRPPLGNSDWLGSRGRPRTPKSLAFQIDNQVWNDRDEWRLTAFGRETAPSPSRFAGPSLSPQAGRGSRCSLSPAGRGLRSVGERERAYAKLDEGVGVGVETVMDAVKIGRAACRERVGE